MKYACMHVCVCTFVNFFQNLLALGSEDHTITINNAEGDTLRQVSFNTNMEEENIANFVDLGIIKR